MTTHRTDRNFAAPSTTHAAAARTRLGLVAATAVLGAMTATGSLAVAAQPQTLKVLEVATSFAGTAGFNASGNKPPTVGQGVVIRGGLYALTERTKGPRLGGVHVDCTFTDSTGGSVCTVVLSLRTGKLVAFGPTPANSAKPYALPILGGNGRYASAKGHVAIRPIGNSNRAVDTIVVS